MRRTISSFRLLFLKILANLGIKVTEIISITLYGRYASTVLKVPPKISCWVTTSHE